MASGSLLLPLLMRTKYTGTLAFTASVSTSSMLRPDSVTSASSPSLKITIRLPDASRKSKARKSDTACSTACAMTVPRSGKFSHSPMLPMSDRLRRMLS